MQNFMYFYIYSIILNSYLVQLIQYQLRHYQNILLLER